MEEELPEGSKVMSTLVHPERARKKEGASDTRDEMKAEHGALPETVSENIIIFGEEAVFVDELDL
jgi:hypothetical protein